MAQTPTNLIFSYSKYPSILKNLSSPEEIHPLEEYTPFGQTGKN